MRMKAIALAALLVAGCGAAGSAPHPPSEPVGQYLLNASANDFHAHRPPDPVRFRDVRLGHRADGGREEAMLCGQFLPAGEQAEWTPFVTLRTSGYEQYIGAQAASFCDRPSITWEDGDLSASLQRRFDSLR